MSYTITGPKAYQTSNNNVIWASQLNASASFLFRYETNGVLADSSGAFVIARDFYTSIAVTIVGAGTTPGTVRLRFYVVNAAGSSFNTTIEVAVGVTHSICVTHDGTANAQFAWVDSVGTRISSFSGVTQGGVSRRWNIAGISDIVPRAGTVWTVDDVNVWNGYTLTASDVLALRSGTDPTTIGLSATQRFRWTLSGTPGVTPVIGDPGLNEYYGQTAYNLIATSGAGSAVYNNSLVWVPSAQAVANYVGTSGRTFIQRFSQIGTGDIVNPTLLVNTPTIEVNGVSLGQLQAPLVTGGQSFAFYKIPGPDPVLPTDVVTISAPTGFMATTAGFAQGMSNVIAVNNAGQSCFRTDSTPKTLKPGLNIEWYPMGENAIAPYMRNRAKSLSYGTGVATRDSYGKPLTLTSTTAFFNYNLFNQSNFIDATRYPGPTGLHAVCWDDLDGGTTWGLSAISSATTVVTERLDLYNPGVNGIGKVRVFDIQCKAGSGAVSTDVQAFLTKADRTPHYDNLFIVAPGDFSYADNTPTSIDRSDPYQMSAAFLAACENVGWLRCWYNLIGGSASPISEIEQIHTLDDFTWGWGATLVANDLQYTSASPFSTVTTPYFYTPVMGESYQGTLVDPIDATTTTLNIQNASSLPILIGQRLTVESETMRVMDVAGSMVTVKRGDANTTPVAHDGNIQIDVNYRVPMPAIGSGAYGNGSVFNLTTTSPHGIMSGQPITFSGSGWPNMATTDPSKFVYPPNFGSPAFVTGPNTFVVKLGTNDSSRANGTYVSPGVTIAGTVTLNPASQTTSIRIPGNPLIPYEMHAKAANQLDVKDVFYSIPHMASDDFAYAVARRIRNSQAPGGRVHVEVSNETWNFANPFYFFLNLTAGLFPGQYGLVSYAERAFRVWAIFREVFDEDGANRSSEIRGYINVQTVNTNGAALLNWAAAKFPPERIDAVAIAPYIYTSPTDANWFDIPTNVMFANLDPDQALDLYIHSQYYQTRNLGVVAFANAWNSRIASYNAATGYDCKLVSYEGSIEEVYNPSMFSTYREFNRDLYYHPNHYIVEQDWIALMQSLGFSLFNIFALSVDWNNNGRYLWGRLHGRQQQWGRGDGSDGKANNLLCLARPGQPHTKSPTTNQDLTNVSVLLQALLDWNKTVNPPTPTTKPRFTPRSTIRVRAR